MGHARLLIIFAFFIFAVASYSRQYGTNFTVPLEDPFLQDLQNVNVTFSLYTKLFEYTNRPIYYISPNGMMIYVLNPMLTFRLIFNISIRDS